jgi:hypothetical protein
MPGTKQLLVNGPAGRLLMGWNWADEKEPHISECRLENWCHFYSFSSRRELAGESISDIVSHKTWRYTA